MKLKSLLSILIATLISTTIILLYQYNVNKTFTEEVITSIINDIDIFKGENIEIIDIYDFDDDKIIAFLSNDTPSTIRFEKNEFGHYNTIDASKVNKNIDNTQVNSTYSMFLHQNIGNDKVNDLILIVASQYNDKKTISFTVNEKVYTVDVKINTPSSAYTLIENPSDDDLNIDWYYEE